MKSLTTNLANTMTYVVSAILILVFFAIDISIDNWVDAEFDNALTDKSNYLKTLVKVTPKGTEFDFSGEFMPEFGSSTKASFFQLWQGSNVFERSESLTQYRDANLLKKDIPLNSAVFADVVLPDGRDGRAMVSYFEPQIPKANRAMISKVEPMWLTIAITTEDLSQISVIIDSTLGIGLLLVIVLIRWAVIKVIYRGLTPLNELNMSLKTVNVNEKHIPLSSDSERYLEIEPIRTELNKFVKISQQYLQTEKRITADIAHELKTPISELISLSEIYIRYPDDERIGGSYKQDVLSISLRMKTIVNNLLLLQQASSESINLHCQPININDLMSRVIDELAFKYSAIHARLIIDNRAADKNYLIDEFSLHLILTNLFDNALYYSPAKSMIPIRLTSDSQGLVISIENQLLTCINANDLERLTLPLFQAEQSRSNSDRHGLGLAIVENVAKLNGFTFSFELVSTDKIMFTLHIPVKADRETGLC
ncbi:MULTISPECIES: HAMP domain-containing sensor histidine kinase [Shewanella]|uniref:sensor histidine kinase n=1 Tax=Shewanella TaxID=22 RepID=UPI000C5910A5|nr:MULTISPECIES: HAMP domain-containing sensor histidine kinase [Shewanella]NCQ46445.1 HAMP domain-containing histidine kinase [Shewanella frigidimarina]NCO72342.1 HAMP domain-containing histidine kinase [Shewanella vesiculosa]NCP38350.1 HAMP domain-containing histidine kinase [Shewanella vesiculosa]NCP70371.1 HAMP domain-containing histidine kinase [Shewanella vesiculosa]NCP75798.1 HAMP domain-containing histidine kinase [Shewanella vesiculosa]